MLNNNYWVQHNAVFCAFIEVPMSRIRFPPPAFFNFYNKSILFKIMYRTSLCSRPWMCSQARTETMSGCGKRSRVSWVQFFSCLKMLWHSRGTGDVEFLATFFSEWIHRDMQISSIDIWSSSPASGVCVPFQIP